VLIPEGGKNASDQLPNGKIQFTEVLDDIIRTTIEKKAQCVLMLIEVSNQAIISSLYGDKFTDQVLKEVEYSIMKLLGNKYFVDYVGQGCIAVILEDCSPRNIDTYARQVYDYIQLFRYTQSIDQPTHVSVKIATVNIPQDAKSAEDSIQKAHNTLKTAKNSVAQYYYPYKETNTKTKDFKKLFIMMDELKQAFIDKRLSLAFQPIINAQNGSVAHYECLLRIVDNNNQIISAGPYIGVAEDLGFVSFIDEIVLDMAIEELKNSENVVLTFNLSAHGIYNRTWLHKAKTLLQNPDLAKRVVIEVTETAAQQDLGQSAYFVATLQELGCRVALDDFGAGHTSFRQLRSLSVDIVKIDGIFIRDIVENHDSLIFVKNLISMSKDFGFSTVAEFVDNAEIAKMLMELKVDYMQGNYFCPAINYRSWN
jgi:EAL domain-containing protein (putative c-di-GMP-specific phosphodiesterase class I)